MLIDWFTVVAQVINFLILVWLMKRFLYQPILNAIDAREKRIASELADADAQKSEAQKERDDYQHKNAAFDQQRATLLAKVTEEAQADRKRLLDEARQDADQLSAKRQESLRNDAHSLHQAIRTRTQQEVFAIARKILTDLAATDLEERIGAMFTRRLRELSRETKDGFAHALKTAAEPARVSSAFDLPAAQRNAIQKALNETFSADVNLKFETMPDSVCGIEISVNGQKIAWSIADYLASLEKSVGALLNPPAQSEGAPPQTTETSKSKASTP